MKALYVAIALILVFSFFLAGFAGPVAADDEVTPSITPVEPDDGGGKAQDEETIPPDTLQYPVTGTEFALSIPAQDHQDYGFTYPVTYSFLIPETAGGLQAHRKESVNGPWTLIPLKTEGEIFSGVEAARFDYDADVAYISLAFPAMSDTQYLKITDQAGSSITITYSGITDYYDNRRAAVVVTVDDVGTPPPWGDNNKFLHASQLFAESGVWWTAGITTVGGNVDWNIYQQGLNMGFLEIASHSRYHPFTPYDDYDFETGGSKEDIINNLTLPNSRDGQEYVWAWIEPSGETDDMVSQKLGEYKYLVSRRTGETIYGQWAAWNASDKHFDRVVPTSFMNNVTYEVLNNIFDIVYSRGGFYHLWGHIGKPDWTPGGNAYEHVKYISGKSDAWYTGFGAMYLYRYARMVVSVSAVETQEPYFTLIINLVGQGSVIRNPDQATYNEGETIELTAMPSASYVFSGWSGDLGGTDNPAYILMDSDKSVTATFISEPPPGELNKYENYTVSNAIDNFYGPYWKGQTFIPDATHTITQIRMPIIRRGTVASGDMVVSIRGTDANGRPAGPDLASGSIPCSSIAVTWSKIWYDIDLGIGCQVQAGVKYAITWRAPGQNSSNPMYYFVNTAGTYADGWAVAGIGGTIWSDLASRNWDANFEEWGSAGPVNHPPVLDPIGNLTAAAGSPLSFTISASDPDGDSLTFSASNLPPGSSFYPSTNYFYWFNPVEGTYPGVHFEVTDGSLTDSEDITITIIPPSTEQTMFENYTTADANWDVYGNIWKAQIFTPQVSHVITKVRLPLIRMGTASGDFIISIQSVDSYGRPEHYDMASGSIPCSSIAASWNKIWYDISLGNGCSLQAGRKYAIVMRAPDQDASNRCYIWVQRGGTYDGGWLCGSTNSGVAWYDEYSQTWDANFEEWGFAGLIPAGAMDFPPRLTADGFVVNALVGPSNTPTEGFIVWGTDGVTFPYEGEHRETTSSGYYDFYASGLTPGTTYYYKIKLVYAVEYYGPVRTVKIWPVTPPGKIAYSEHDVIYIMNPDGTGTVNLGTGINPAISPDGLKIAFTIGYLENSVIWTMNVDGSNRVSLGAGTSPSWSPDGTKIVFSTNNQVWTMNADGSNRAYLTDGVYPAWSPDGTKIAFSLVSTHQPEPYTGGNLCIINIDGSGLTVLTEGNSTYDADWSPDGTKIAYTRYLYRPIGPVNAIEVISTGGAISGQYSLNILNSTCSDPSWSPDGQYIVFYGSGVSTAPVYSNMYIVNSDFSSVVRLFDYDDRYRYYPDWGPAWTPPVNHPPILSPIGNKTVTEGEMLQFTISATDPDAGDMLGYSASNLPGDAEFDKATHTFTWASPVAGVYPGVHFEVTDGELTDFEDITITVNPVSGEEIMYENYTVSNAIDNFYGPYWKGQTFIPDTAHTLTKLRLAILRRGTVASGDVVVSIRGTDANGRPTGPDLASGSISCSSIAVTWSKIWYEFDLGAGYEVQAGTKYAIIWRAPDMNSSNPMYYFVNTAGTYPDGWTLAGISGTTWSDLSSRNWDANFEEWGVTGAPSNAPPAIAPIDDITCVEGDLVTIPVHVTDPDDTIFSFEFFNLPADMTFNGGARTLMWTAGPAGIYPDITVKAIDGEGAFDTESFTITVNPAPVTQYTLTVNISGQGAVTKDPDQPLYEDGDEVELTAVPSAGYIFSGWSGDLTGSDNPGYILMDNNKTVTATFVPEALPGELLKYEEYVTSNAIDIFYGTSWKAQTFTPQVSHKLTRVRLPLLKRGSPAGDVVVSIRAADANGRPTGPDLATGSIPCSGIIMSWNLYWYDIDLGGGCNVEAGVKYAIAWRASGADASNPLYYGVNTAGTYGGGWALGSSGGVTWADLASRNWDANFEEWGYE